MKKRYSDNDEPRESRRERLMRERQNLVEFANSKTCMVLLTILSLVIFIIISSLLPDDLGRKDEDYGYTLPFDYMPNEPEN